MVAELLPIFEPTPSSVAEIARRLPAHLRARIEWFPQALRRSFIEPLARASPGEFHVRLDELTVDAVRTVLQLVASLGELTAILAPEVIAQAIDVLVRGNVCPPGVIERIVEVTHSEEIWLFGSRARGTAGPESDWDLLVVVPDAASTPFDDAMWSALREVRRQQVDLVPIRRTDFEADRREFGTLAQIATTSGRRVHGR